MARSSFGTIEKRGKNVYRVRWSENGTRHSHLVHGTKAQAEKYLAQVHLGIIGSGELPLSIYWTKSVLPTLDKLSARSKSDYINAWNKWLEPAFGAKAVGSITWRDIQALIDKSPSPSAARKSYVLIRKIMNFAIKDGLISTNPASNATLPTVKKTPAQIIEAPQILPFLDAIKDTKYEPVILCLLGGGMRPEEARALTWSDIQAYESNGKQYALVRIDKTLVIVEGKAVLQNSTKTQSSTREVMIGEPFASRLLELQGSGYICQSEGGLPTHPATMSHNWKQWQERREMRPVTMEHLRHSYATALGEAGCPDSIVQLQMGHAGTSVKARHYQQTTRRALMLAADMYEEIINA